MSRYIDADELKDYINGNEQFIDWQKKEIVECIDCCETIGWIPCSVRFPEEFGLYNVTVKCEDGLLESVESFYNPEVILLDDRWSVCCSVKNRKVIAWMPKPDPFDPESVK